MDQATKYARGVCEGHVSEVIGLSFYDKQHQLVSVSQAGVVILWDSQKLVQL